MTRRKIAEHAPNVPRITKPFVALGTGGCSMPDVPPVPQIARGVLRNLPHVRCFPCLSLQVGVSEKDAREAAQVLVVRNDFFVARRRCQTCARTESALVSGKEP
jgi:hypothetical protein